VLLHLTNGSSARELMCSGPEAQHLYDLITQACLLRNLIVDDAY
jgi:hypothetical protein